MGINHGEGVIHEGVPDLFFFLEAQKDSPARKTMQKAYPNIVKIVSDLQAEDQSTHWFAEPDEWLVIWARRSLVEIARSQDSRLATVDFFQRCFSSVKSAGLLKMYVDAAK